MTVDYHTLRAANAARHVEWDPDSKIDLSYRGNELAGETGEACNVIKKLERERHGMRGSRASADQLADELADVVICSDLIAMNKGIDLESAVRCKFNATSEKYNLATRMVPPRDALSGLETIVALAAAVLAEREFIRSPAQARLALALYDLDPASLACKDNCTCSDPIGCDECAPRDSHLAALRALAIRDGAAP